MKVYSNSNFKDRGSMTMVESNKKKIKEVKNKKFLQQETRNNITKRLKVQELWTRMFKCWPMVGLYRSHGLRHACHLAFMHESCEWGWVECSSYYKINIYAYITICTISCD